MHSRIRILNLVGVITKNRKVQNVSSILCYSIAVKKLGAVAKDVAAIIRKKKVSHIFSILHFWLYWKQVFLMYHLIHFISWKKLKMCLWFWRKIDKQRMITCDVVRCLSLTFFASILSRINHLRYFRFFASTCDQRKNRWIRLYVVFSLLSSALGKSCAIQG